MKIHQIRNATIIIEVKENYILVDPMLGEKGSLPPFSFIRNRPLKNPLVPIKKSSFELLDKVNYSLVTHCQKWNFEPLTHTDHFDKAGREFLKDREIPVVCLNKDISYMTKRGINIHTGLDYFKEKAFLGGKITAVPAKHGHGWNHKLMANGCGFFLEFPDEPSVYISGDTVLTDEVKRVLKEFKPDISIVAAGSARMDIGGYILMTLSEVIDFVKASPGKVIANHMDALNHCSTSRTILKSELEKNGLLSETLIPEDGETISF